MPGLLAHFPDLPEALDNIQWSHEVHAAHQILTDGYQSAHLLLRREDGDAMRLRHHSQRITSNLVHLLEALEQEGLPIDWIVCCAHALAGLKVELESAAVGAEQDDTAHSEKKTYVTEVYTGCRGQPRKDINLVWLNEATKGNRRLNMKTLADLLGIH
ncbi:hypothetical protein JB92DRAFT_3222038 [Gautieria morchelliformis]|nr:hypothetical protein JB92DRAFT_2835695 [Gautieria morchelliformis]KAF8532462.1 hypothetical protein JB92DRAFT_3222038 [Gautieria morchelliformis]